MKLSSRELTELSQMIYQWTGVQIGQQRHTMVEGRLKRRLRALNLSSFKEYIALLKINFSEQRLFVDAMTTHETYFYRTPRIWSFIESSILQNWRTTHPGQVFKAWSAASSSGEEAYTLAMLCEDFRQQFPLFKYKISGTDVSEQIIEKCTLAQYSGRSIDLLSKHQRKWLSDYLVSQSNGSYEVIKDIKRNVRFSALNLFATESFKDRFDIVLLRNVLIYFSVDDQIKILKNVQKNLNPNGYLIIGESESLNYHQTKFRYIEPMIYKWEAS